MKSSLARSEWPVAVTTARACDGCGLVQRCFLARPLPTTMANAGTLCAGAIRLPVANGFTAAIRLLPRCSRSVTVSLKTSSAKPRG